MSLEFGEQRAEMRSDGVDREVELTGDLAVGVALGDQHKDLQLTVCERLPGSIPGSSHLRDHAAHRS